MQKSRPIPMARTRTIMDESFHRQEGANAGGSKSRSARAAQYTTAAVRLQVRLLEPLGGAASTAVPKCDSSQVADGCRGRQSNISSQAQQDSLRGDAGAAGKLQPNLSRSVAAGQQGKLQLPVQWPLSATADEPR